MVIVNDDDEGWWRIVIVSGDNSEDGDGDDNCDDFEQRTNRPHSKCKANRISTQPYKHVDPIISLPIVSTGMGEGSLLKSLGGSIVCRCRDQVTQSADVCTM